MNAARLLRRSARTAARWLLDWKNGVTVLGTVMVVLLAFIVFDAARARDKALDAAIASDEESIVQRAATTRRIDLLLDEIEALRLEAFANGERIGGLTEQIGVLQEQVRRLGGVPFTTSTTSAPSAGQRPSSPAPAPSPRPAPPSRPAPRPAPTPPQPPPAPEPEPGGVCLLGICLGEP